MKRLAPLAAAAALVLAGCSSHPDAIEPPPLASFERAFDTDRLWHRSAGRGTRFDVTELTPAVTERHVFVADVEGRLQSLRREDGRRLWRRQTGLRISSLAAGYGVLVLGTRNGELVALSSQTGEQRWRIPVSSEVLSPAALDGENAVFQTLDGRITAVDLATGETRWMYEQNVPVLSLRGTASPVLDGGRVYAAFASGKVAALDLATGLPLWERQVAEPSGRSELERLVDIDGNLIVENGGVFAATFQGRLAVLDQESGRPFWDKDMSTHEQMSSSVGALFLADAEGAVWSIDQRSGSALWKNEAFRGRGLVGTAVQSGLVVTGDAEGYLHWLDSIDGRQVARRMFDPDGFAAPPVVYDDVLYVLSRDGELAAFVVEPLE